MGKSSTSCFNIITCGGGGGDHDAITEDALLSHSVKVSSDKRRWSFRKKSSTHRILSNNLPVETTQIPLNKTANSEAVDFHEEIVYSVEDKISASNDAKTSPPTSQELKTLQIGDVGDDESKVDENIEDYFAAVLESSIHVLLAQDKMENLKSLVKLQAVVRGHLVRRRAIGTLRCVQAIAKFQTLVRNRQSCALLQKSKRGKQTDIHDEDSFSSVLISTSVYKRTKQSTFLETLLANQFACQLVKSEPKRKPFSFKCDSLNNPGCGAWLWLERWTCVSSLSEQYRAAEYNDKAPVNNPPSPPPLLNNSLLPVLTAQEPHSIPTHHPFTFIAKSKFEELSLGTEFPLTPTHDQPHSEDKVVGEMKEREGERVAERVVCETPERMVGMRSGKRGRYSGLVRGEGEEKDNSSSLPSYMQSTESARAKVSQACSSPRSSPDVGAGDGDFLLRKRQSLPGAGSSMPHIPPHKAKFNISSAPHERSWQR